MKKSSIDKGFRGHILLNEMYRISLQELFMLKVKTGFIRMKFVENGMHSVVSCGLRIMDSVPNSSLIRKQLVC